MENEALRPHPADPFAARLRDEMAEPPVWGRCGYCGRRITLGEDYWLHDGLCICGGCTRPYAWACFLEQAAQHTAQTRGPL